MLLCHCGKVDMVGSTYASYATHADYSEDFVLWVVAKLIAAPPFSCWTGV